jgi:hypothetical protein
MRFVDAKTQFEIRYYLWAISEFEREIEESFPTFHLFKTGPVWETLQFMRLLDRAKQRTLAHALLKRFHPKAVTALGETTSDEEIALRSARDNFRELRRIYGYILELEVTNHVAEAQFWLSQIGRDSVTLLTNVSFADDDSFRSQLDSLLGSIPRSLEEEIALRKKAGGKIRFITKRKLLKVMAERFQNAFAGQCVESLRQVEVDPFLSFDIKCGDWVLSTYFWFGRSSSLLNYSHGIASNTAVDHHGPKGKYMAPLVMGSHISFSSWLGLTSQVQWECITDQEVEPACDGAIKLCNHFFGVAPKLLKGLEFETLDKEIHTS